MKKIKATEVEEPAGKGGFGSVYKVKLAYVSILYACTHVRMYHYCVHQVLIFAPMQLF